MARNGLFSNQPVVLTPSLFGITVVCCQDAEVIPPVPQRVLSAHYRKITNCSSGLRLFVLVSEASWFSS